MNERLFWSKVSKGAGCWEWQGGISRNGYGVFHIDRKTHSAHRVAWIIANEQDIPVGALICHTCDNKKCVRPDHLYAGDPVSNCRDREERQRQSMMPKPRRTPKRKRTAYASGEEVRTVRSRYREGESQRSIALDLGLHQSDVSLIVNGKVKIQ